jgi:DNA-binding response OmpR family regulator
MRILIVDDDKLFADQLCLNLKSKISLVNTAYSYEEAVQKLSSTPYDIILQDYDLGISNGLDVIENLKSLKESPMVILMTSYATKELAIKSINLGVNRFIEKPFRVKELLSLIEIDKKTQNDFKLDPKNYKVTDKGREFKLTEIEYKILNFMVLNRGALITKEEIHNLIYKSDVKARNAINTHITNLKNKLPSFSKNLNTMRGQGYVFQNNS